jgi:hypothetical protein
MRHNEILNADLRALGLWIDEDDHFVYLKCGNETVARWWGWAARLNAIRSAARSWAKNHDERR